MDRNRVIVAAERRRHVRVDLEAVAIWKDGREEAAVTLDVENISEGGVLLRCARAMPEGQQVTIELTLPAGFIPLGPRVLVLRGRVIRTEAADDTVRVAVAFIDVGETEEDAIAKYVRRRSILGRP